jgi:hypothetical protein
VHIGLDIQAVVQARIVGWRARGYTIGFCIGLTKGPATVGRMGYEGRTDHTAISSNVEFGAPYVRRAPPPRGSDPDPARVAAEVGGARSAFTAAVKIRRLSSRSALSQVAI